MSERKGDWAQTYTGKQFWPLDPRAEDIDLKDISHGLANLCRFNGHCKSFYSVAQHSVLVSKMVSQEQKLAALFHDASESYTGDLIGPLKRSLPPEFKQIELRIEGLIYQTLGITNVNHDEIKLADRRALVTEMRDVMGRPPAKWNEDGLFEPHPEKIIPLMPNEAEQAFLERYEKLRQRQK